MRKQNKFIIFILIVIIILLIFAGISILELTGNGLFKRAKKQEIDETTVTYEINPEGYTNKDKVETLIKISNQKGIKTIKYPEGDELYCNGQTKIGIDYTVTKNGTYTFKIIDNEDKETSKDMIIHNIDRIKPKSVIIEKIRVVASTLQFNITAEDGDETEESSKSGIEKCEIYINNQKAGETTENYYKIENLNEGIYNIHIIAYDMAGNSTESEIYEIKTMAIPTPITRLAFNGENTQKTASDYYVFTPDGIKNCFLEPNIGDNFTFEITTEKMENMEFYYTLDAGQNWILYTGPVTTEYVGDNNLFVKSVQKYNDETLESYWEKIRYYDFDDEITPTASDGLNKNQLFGGADIRKCWFT